MNTALLTQAQLRVLQYDMACARPHCIISYFAVFV